MVKDLLPLDGVVVDIGNTDFKYALMAGQEIQSIHRTVRCPNLSQYHVPIVGCSVVPKRQHQLDRLANVRWVDHSNIPILAPTQVGMDRLVALYAAKMLYHTDTVLVIDVGTFLTLSVLHQNVFVGGYIIPGPHTMMASYGEGAQLHKDQIWTPPQKGLLPQDTLNAMQKGTTEILQRGLSSLIAEIKSQYPNLLGVGTGGAAIDLLTPLADVDIINPTLILEGLGKLV